MKKQVLHKVSNSSIRSQGEALLGLQINLRVTSDQLKELIAVSSIIFADQNFMTTLELEGLTMIPHCLCKGVQR